LTDVNQAPSSQCSDRVADNRAAYTERGPEIRHARKPLARLYLADNDPALQLIGDLIAQRLCT
jgi:hypothetical protein